MSAGVLSPQARRDLLQAARWIAKDNPIAARAFRESVAMAARRMGGHPQIGVLKPGLAAPTIRFLPLAGLPHIIVYDAARRPPLILRVLHTARDLPELLRDL